MNIKQTVSIGLLTLGIGFFGMKSVDAQSPVTQQPSSFTIAQLTEASSPIYGTYKLQYSVNGIIHESILRMRGYSGIMRTRYFNPQRRKTVVVDQTMELKSSSSGLILLGSNPVYAGTTIPAEYSADNFLFQIRPDGTLVVFTCDDAKQCSPVDLEVIR
ncbi:MAG: hypothetical protein HEQ19_09285 [Gloeotrichia echinulata CP02]|jgi:hypothetical protein